MTTAMTMPTTSGGGLVIKGKTDTGMSLSRVAMFQGTAEEEKMYGEHRRGTFLDVLEVRPLGEKIQIVPIAAFARYSRWEEGNNQPVESWENEADVPAALLQWTEDPDGKRHPPEARESINVVCAVKGEAFPYLFVFKSTGLKAFNKTILPLEQRRAIMGKGHGLYELGSVDDKNSNNQTYKRLTARPVGEPDAELQAIVDKVKQVQSHIETTARDMADDAAPDDGIPI